MVSEWRVVRSKNIGLVSTYFFDDSLTIENLKGEQRGLLFDELKDFKERICGVVPLVNDSYGIAIVDKMEQKALNCLAIDVINLGHSSDLEYNYVLGEVMNEAGARFIDLLYDTITGELNYISSLTKVNDITYFVDSHYADYLYRTIITIRDLSQFKLLYTKYNITRNK